MKNPILTAFGATEILNGFDPLAHRILVELDGSYVGEVEPERHGRMEMAYAFQYRGVTRGRDGATPIGPAFDAGTMKRRLISVMFNGDADAMDRAKLVKVVRR